jgi:hypothetical protein
MKVVLQDAQEVAVSSVTMEIRYINKIKKEIMAINTAPDILGTVTFDQLADIFTKANITHLTVLNSAGEQLVESNNMMEVISIAQNFTEEEQMITVRLSE